MKRIVFKSHDTVSNLTVSSHSVIEYLWKNFQPVTSKQNKDQVYDVATL